MANITFIGAGRLAYNLAPALQQAGHCILQIYSHTQQSAEELASRLHLPQARAISCLADIAPTAEVYVYALRDEVLQVVVSQVHVGKDALHLHTSGSMPMSVFGDDKPCCGVFYPFQTFSKEKEVDFQAIPILVEGSDAEQSLRLQALAESISQKVYTASATERGKLHIAGVFASNFVNCMYAIAKEQLADTTLPFEVLLPLIDETAQKVHLLDPRKAQTGPAVRHDTEVMQQHLARLNSPELRTLYELLSQNIQSHEA